MSWRFAPGTIALGNDALRLAARLHGQCEVHCYIEGEDRSWFADLIDDARRIHLFRDGMGHDDWPALVELLREDDASPVVCSYSVCESFPEMPDNWDAEMEDLRRRAGGLRIQPSNMGELFYIELTALDINLALMEFNRQQGGK